MISISRSLFKNFPTTFPRPLGIDKKLIIPTDVVKDFGHLKLIRARPSHVPIIEQTVQDFMKNEILVAALGVKDLPEIIANYISRVCLRYPVSYFAVNNQDEVVTIALSNVIFKNPMDDEIPVSEPELAGHPFEAVVAVLVAGEQMHFDRTKADRLMHHEIAFTPTVLRRRGISSTVYPTIMKAVVATADAMGIRHHVGMTTCVANYKNFEKLSWKKVGQLPKTVYKRTDGQPIEWPEGEGPSILIELDRDRATRNGIL